MPIIIFASPVNAFRCIHYAWKGPVLSHKVNLNFKKVTAGMNLGPES